MVFLAQGVNFSGIGTKLHRFNLKFRIVIVQVSEI